MNLNLRQDSAARFGQYFEAYLLWIGGCFVGDFEVDAWSRL